jgi:hypothetical protein
MEFWDSLKSKMWALVDALLRPYKAREVWLGGLLAVEWVITMPLFIASWLLSAVYHSVLYGWEMGGKPEKEKRAQMMQLMSGDDAHAG